MAIEKPAPLQIGNRYYYTLTSYDPVSITVTVPKVTDDDVEWSIKALARRSKIEPEQLDDAWVAANVEGVDTVDQLKDALHSQLDDMNSRYTEQSKPALCTRELAKRLCQSVPADEVARTRQMVLQSLEADAQSQGGSLQDMLAQTGMSQMSLDKMLDDEAQATAEQEAALAAFAEEKKLKVDDAELPALLNLSPTDTDSLIKQAKEHGQMDQLREAALREKASRSVAAECSCTYEIESAEAAKKRIEQYEMLDQMQQGTGKTDADSGDEDASDKRGEFKLV